MEGREFVVVVYAKCLLSLLQVRDWHHNEASLSPRETHFGTETETETNLESWLLKLERPTFGLMVRVRFR